MCRLGPWPWLASAVEKTRGDMASGSWEEHTGQGQAWELPDVILP